MTYLIDGYNLLYAMGVLHGRRAENPAGLENARVRLLRLLQGAYGDDAGRVTVVFDAAKAPPGTKEEHRYKGIRVCFAVGVASADDLIEELIEHESAPRQVAVVSNDRRVQKAAKRRGCTVLKCLDYLERLPHPTAKPPGSAPTGAPAKPEGVSAAETRYWLDEFADLENSPDLRELSGPDFGEVPEG